MCAGHLADHCSNEHSHLALLSLPSSLQSYAAPRPSGHPHLASVARSFFSIDPSATSPSSSSRPNLTFVAPYGLSLPLVQSLPWMPSLATRQAVAVDAVLAVDTEIAVDAAIDVDAVAVVGQAINTGLVPSAFGCFFISHRVLRLTIFPVRVHTVNGAMLVDIITESSCRLVNNANFSHAGKSVNFTSRVVS